MSADFWLREFGGGTRTGSIDVLCRCENEKRGGEQEQDAAQHAQAVLPRRAPRVQAIGIERLVDLERGDESDKSGQSKGGQVCRSQPQRKKDRDQGADPNPESPIEHSVILYPKVQQPLLAQVRRSPPLRPSTSTWIRPAASWSSSSAWRGHGRSKSSGKRAECGRSPRAAETWRILFADRIAREAVTYCPECAEREFGRAPGSVARRAACRPRGSTLRRSLRLELQAHFHELDRRVEPMRGHDPRQLEHGGDARAIVIGARRIALEVENICATGVEMPAHHVDSIGADGLSRPVPGNTPV